MNGAAATVGGVEGELAVEALAPEVRLVFDVGQLGRDPQPLPRPPHAALQQVAHAGLQAVVGSGHANESVSFDRRDQTSARKWQLVVLHARAEPVLL